MTRARHLLACALSVAVVGTTVAPPRAAFAQKDDKKKKKLAKSYVDAGLAAQEAGDFDSAVEFYQKAYDTLPHPVLLFNMAQAHRLAGHKAEALDLYKRYLADDPKGPKAKDAKGFIAQLEPEVQAEIDAKKKADDDAAAAAAAAEQARIDAEKKQADDGKPKQQPDDATPPPDDGSEPDVPDEPSSPGLGGKRIAGLVLGGVGLAGIGGGVFFGLKAKGLSDDLSEPGAPFDPDKVSQGEAAERNMFICYGVGGALVIAGAVLFIIGAPHSDAGDELAFTPAVGPDLTGIVIAGGF